MKKLVIIIVTVIAFLSIPIMNFGQIAPDLNSAANFGILAGTTITSAGSPSVINDMDVGLSPGSRSSITGFPPSTVVNGDIYAADDIAPPGVPAMLIQAKQDLQDAYLYASGASTPAPVTVSGDQGGVTLYPGIYKSTSSLLIQSGNLTLDALGDANAVWIFQVASELTTIGGGPNPSPSGGNVILTNSAVANNVYWQVGTSATIGDYTDFKGNILALTSITMNTGSTIDGRLLARNGAVTLSGLSTMDKPEESPPVTTEFTVTKIADPQFYTAVGEMISYDITVENTGGAPLTDINVSDDLTAGAWVFSLNPGESNTETVSYTILQSDLDNGFVTNIATAEVNNVTVHAIEVVTYDVPSSVPLTNWSIYLIIILMALTIVFITFRKFSR